MLASSLSLVLLCLFVIVARAQTDVDCAGVENGTSQLDACGVCDGDDSSCIDCSGVPNGSSKYDECDVCDGDGTSCCGPQTGRECCVNYSGVPDPYWDFVLLPVTLNDVIDKLRFTNEVFAYLASALPPYDLIGPQSRDLHFGRMAEFNNVFLTECLEDYCEASGKLYGSLVLDNADVSC